MPFESKAALFETDLGNLAGWCAALAHPARLTILQVLARKQTCICGEIVDEVPLSQASVSRHLKTLKEAGLIRGEIEGPRSCYCIDAAAFESLRTAMAGFLASIPPQPEEPCCS